MTDQSSREMIKSKLRQHFDGKIVRKDLTKKIKEGANVPVYVLEFLLGQYCCSDDDEIIDKGVQTVKRILADNFVRPDEAQKILARLRSNGSHTVIDMITASLDIRRNSFYADFSNLGLQDVPIDDCYPSSMTVCSAVESGASFSWSTNTTRRSGTTAIPSASASSLPSRCLTLTSEI